jgi:ParB family chromosome partitioning protein
LKALRRKLAATESNGSQSGEDESEHAGAAVSTPPKPRIAAKLLDELMAHKTLALRAEIASKPDLALRLLVLGLASSTLNHDYNTCSLVAVRVDEADAAKHITRSESKAPQALAEITLPWRNSLPAGTDALWAFVREAEQQTLLDLLAVLVAPAIELRATRAPGVADAICAAACLDMSKYWKASLGSYFEHVRKDVIVDAIMEANPSLDRAQLDKSAKKEVLARAKRMFKGSAWLPEPLRVSAVAPQTIGPDAIAAE